MDHVVSQWWVVAGDEDVAAAAGSNVDFAVAVMALLFLVFGIIVGEHLGEELAKQCVTKKSYWLANLGVMLAGVLASALVWATGFVVLAAVVIGLMGGAVAGLKFGFGESAGPWKFHDKTFRVNKKQVETAESGRGEARRRRRKEGGPEPELMSVATDAPSAAQQDNKKGSHKG